MGSFTEASARGAGCALQHHAHVGPGHLDARAEEVHEEGAPVACRV